MSKSWDYQPVAVSDGLSALQALPLRTRRTWPCSTGACLAAWMAFKSAANSVKNRNGPYTYVVLVTGQGVKQDMLDGMQAGADDYLVKPIDPLELHARLNAGSRIVTLQEQLLAAQRQLREQATRDALTGLWNRRAILDLLQQELARGRREDSPVGLLMADLDHFKRVNDTLGHLAGDEVLRQAARRLRAALRPYDTVGRYGGEEFLVVLPGCAPATALVLAERLCRHMAAEPVSCEGVNIAITLSVGVAAWEGVGDSAGLLSAADAALFRAKRAGRNCVALDLVAQKRLESST